MKIVKKGRQHLEMSDFDARLCAQRSLLDDNQVSRRLANIVLDLLDEKHGGKVPVDRHRYRRSAQGENDPCGRCGHPYYRHFDWMEDYEHVGCKYCPECPEFQEVS